MPRENGPAASRGIKVDRASQDAFVQGQHRLLAIGIDRYPHCPDLYNAVKDAQDLVALLHDEYLFDPDHTLTLFNEQATQGAIYRALEKLDGTTAPEDNLLIYFSGHGEFKDSIDEGFWIPYDGRLDNHGSFLPFSIISKYLRAISSRHTVVIADSCYAGSMFTQRKLTPDEQALRRLYGIPSRWLLTAGRNEVVSDGKPGDNSPFADSLLWHLRNHPDGLLSIRELCQRVVNDVSSNAHQLPRGEPIFNVGHRGGEFLFIRRSHTDFLDQVEAAPPKPPDSETRTRSGETTPTQPDPPPRPEPSAPQETGPFPSVSSIVESLQRHLAASELDRVFELFDRVLRPDGSLADDLILTRGQFSSLNRNRAAGTISPQQVELTTNRIRNALLYYVRNLDADDLKPDAIQAPGADADTAEPVSRDSLEREAEVLRKKIDFFKEEMGGLHDLNQRFNLKLQIDEAESRLEAIERELKG